MHFIPKYISYDFRNYVFGIGVFFIDIPTYIIANAFH